MKERGKFVLFEGVGNAGKSTQLAYAESLLRVNGFKVVVTREPGGTRASEIIRELIFKLKENELIGPEGQMVLFFGARSIWMEQEIKPRLKKGIHILSDRSYPATGAYQGCAEGGDMKTILAIADIVMGKNKPDFVILLDISLDTAKKRGRETDDPFDKESDEYFKKVIEGYRQMAKEGWGGLKWYVVDGNPPFEQVSSQIKEVLGDIFNCKFINDVPIPKLSGV